MNDKNLKLIPQDYDKNPIEIEDYNALFYFIVMAMLIPVLIYIFFVNSGALSKDSLFRNIVIIIPLCMYPFLSAYLKSKGKRKVILTRDSIKFMHRNIIIEEILLKNITEIKKTFNNIYHKSQKLNELKSFFMYLLIFMIVISQELYSILLVIPLFHLFILFVKYIFHKIKDKNYKYRLFDAILVYSGDKCINILPITSKQFEEVRKYFLDNGLEDIQNKKIYFELMGHLPENISLNRD